MQIFTFKTVEELHSEAANRIISLVRENPKCVLGLSTGSSPIGVYKKLIADHKANGTTYQEVVTFNLDEYEGLDGSSEHSYRYFMNDELFDHLDIKKENTHLPSGIGDLVQNCAQYEEEIKAAGGIDLQLTGIGTNGHIAFNEPGTSFDTYTHIAELTQSTIDSNAKFFPSREEIPTRAISMGIQSIMETRQVLMIAYGKSKAQAIKQMIDGPVSEDLPASILQRHANAIVLLDKEAASELTR